MVKFLIPDGEETHHKIILTPWQGTSLVRQLVLTQPIQMPEQGGIFLFIVRGWQLLRGVDSVWAR